MIDLVFRNLAGEQEFDKIFFEKILGLAAEELDLPGKKGISINLVEEEKIRELNKKYRNKDKITDVLSFPMEAARLQPSLGEAGESDLGDIFICLPFAKTQAKSENVNIERKLAQLAVHGFLHLLGYDHERSEPDAREMFKLENKILSKL